MIFTDVNIDPVHGLCGHQVQQTKIVTKYYVNRLIMAIEYRCHWQNCRHGRNQDKADLMCAANFMPQGAAYTH